MSRKAAVLANLTEAKRLLTEKGWTQGSMAETAFGEPVSVSDERAELFCALGAMVKANGRGVNGARFAVESAIRNGRTGYSNVVPFNDTRQRGPEGLRQVLEVFDGAIELVKSDTDDLAAMRADLLRSDHYLGVLAFDVDRYLDSEAYDGA